MSSVDLLDISIEKIYYSKTTQYKQGIFLGKGGYGLCFQVSDPKGNQYALKEIEFKSKKGQDTSALILKELKIQRHLNHENIVKLFNYFTSDSKVCIILELCTNHTLLELLTRRKRVTEPEARYFLKQIVSGCQYLHSQGVIHRDLKLNNLLLDKNVNVKIADFGLSTKVVENKQNRTICGTIHYMAPEMMSKSTYSYSADMWSVGCILYNLLLGSHPFPLKTSKEVSSAIINDPYVLPIGLTPSAEEIIELLLEKNPFKRPSATNVLELNFLKEFVPDSLPTSVLTVAPRFDLLAKHNKSIGEDLAKTVYYKNSSFSYLLNSKDDIHNNYMKENLKKLAFQLDSLIKTAFVLTSYETELSKLLDLMSNSKSPSLAPIYWISKWVDFGEDFGLGYQLTDSSSGVVFIDNTRMVMTENKQNLQYIDLKKTEYLYTYENLPQNLFKKREILKHFQNYMQINLETAGQQLVNVEKESMVRLPYLESHVRTSEFIAFYLTNGTFQINFLQDHVKLVLCPIMKALTYIKGPDIYNTYEMEHMKQNGMILDVQNRLAFCLEKLRHF